MILHLLHNPALYRDCAALLTEHDTLLLLDDATDDTFIRSLTHLPCSVKVLDSADSRTKGQPLEPQRITVDEWVSLVIAHRHSMTWG
jgi:sulfur transfer complex TusBCD TusB component (DsrH family)